MSKIDYQALREAAEKATKGSYIVGHTSVNQHGNLTGVFVCQKWKGEPGGVIAECHVNCLVETDVQAYANAEFIAAFNPNVALALLDEINALEETRINDVCRIAELTKQLELAKSKLNEQREYYEGVISDGSKRIAELESGSQVQKLVEAIIVAIENEQERLFDEDFQMEQQANAEFIAAANPATVLALLDERERNQQYIKSRDQENEDIALTVGKLRVELETAEKRIAELEAREISLPERSSMLHRTDFHEDYQTVMAYKVSEVIAAIRAAGIRIKGE